MDDHRLSAAVAEMAGRALTELREREQPGGFDPWEMRDDGDRLAHNLIVEQLTEARPDDVIMSEEGRDDRRRLEADRTWIVDPLDGTHDFPFLDSFEWAVHIALVEDQRPTAAAVAVPGLGQVFATDLDGPGRPTEREQPIVISGRSNGYMAGEVAEAIGGKFTACGSSGVKAMLVVSGAVDVYVHASGLYEWDVCAPAAVAEALGMVVTDLEGNEIVYNKSQPIVRGFVVSRPEFAEITRETLDKLI